MTNRIVPIFSNKHLSTVPDPNSEVTVEETSIKINYRETGTVAEYTVKTNQGVIRGFSEGNMIDSNNQLPEFSSQDHIIKGSDQQSIAAPEVAAINSNNTLPVVAAQDRTIMPSNQLPAVPVSFHTADFVPVVGSFNQLPTLPADPYDISHFQLYVKNKFCYNSAPVAKARIVKAQERVGYRVDIWTLMERRTVKWEERPYRGESTPGKLLPDIFNLQDLPFDTPETVIKGNQKVACPLEDTQRKVACNSCTGKGKMSCDSCYGHGHVIPRNNNRTQCSKCHGQGTLNCTKCMGSGSLLTWAVLTVEWNTIDTKACYQNTFLPEKMILTRLKKSILYDDDLEWNNSLFLTNFGTLYETILARSPEDLAKRFGQDIQKQYQTHYARIKDQMIIRRMKCLIRQVDIIEMEYQLEGYTNKSEQHSGKCHSTTTKLSVMKNK